MTTTKNDRQIQDYANGYYLGYYEATNGETSVEVRSPSNEHAQGVADGLRDGRAGLPRLSRAERAKRIQEFAGRAVEIDRDGHIDGSRYFDPSRR